MAKIKKVTIPKDIRAAIKYNVEKDIMERLQSDIGDYVGHYIGKMHLNFDDQKTLDRACYTLEEIFYKEIKSKLGK